MTAQGFRSLRPGAGWQACLALFALLVLTWLCYSPGLGGPLLLDDEPVLLPLFQQLDAGNWRTVAPQFVWTGTGPLGRPLAMLSFIASIVTHGDVAGLKLDNVFLHLLCGVLVVAWVRVLQLAAGTARPGAPWTALLVGGLWLLHPLMVSTVLYAVQRMTVLSTLFTLLGLLAYTLGRTRQRAAAQDPCAAGPLARADATGQLAQAAARLTGWRFSSLALLLMCFLVCLPLAVLSKENGVLLVPLCALVEAIVFRASGTPQQRRAVRGIFGVLLVLPIVLGVTVFLPAISTVLAQGYALRNFTLGERLLTESRVLVLYLVEWAAPLARNLSFYHDNFPVSHGWWAPWTTAASFGLLGAVTVVSYRVRRSLPLVSLGWSMFLVGHSLEAGVVPLELVFEHRNYLPSIGLALALVSLPWARALSRGVARPLAPYLPIANARRYGRRVSALFALVLLIACAYQTSVRSHTWGQAGRLFPRLYAANPDSPRLAALFANTYANAGQFDSALRVLDHQDTLGAMLQRLDLVCLARRPIDQATLDAALANLHGIMAGYEVVQTVHLANDVLEQRCGLPIPWGLSLLERVLKLPITQPSSRQLLWLYSAHLHHAAGALPAAQADLLASAGADPGNPLPLLLAGEWAMDAHDLPAARAALDAALRCRDADRAEHRSLFEHLRVRLEIPAP